MVFSGRRLLLVLSIVIVACGIVMVIAPGNEWLAVIIAACGFTIALLLNLFRPPTTAGRVEEDDISKVRPERRAELMRGTGKFLREMGYRYSIRMDTNPSASRPCFTAEVNSVRLGFIPALVTDNTNDRQGYGYVAFVYDSRRWRGPGMPCPDGQTEAVQHAAQCVSPLASDEETQF